MSSLLVIDAKFYWTQLNVLFHFMSLERYSLSAFLQDCNIRTLVLIFLFEMGSNILITHLCYRRLILIQDTCCQYLLSYQLPIPHLWSLLILILEKCECSHGDVCLAIKPSDEGISYWSLDPTTEHSTAKLYSSSEQSVHYIFVPFRITVTHI